jgi:hypothetical protein
MVMVYFRLLPLAAKQTSAAPHTAILGNSHYLYKWCFSAAFVQDSQKVVKISSPCVLSA